MQVRTVSEDLVRLYRTRRQSSDLLRAPAGEGEVLQGRADGAFLLGTLQPACRSSRGSRR